MQGILGTAAGVALGGIGLKLAGVFAGAAGGAIDFGKQMANVNSIAQLGTADFNKLSDAVLKVVSDPRITAGAAEIASGLYDVYSSGFKGADAINIVTTSAIAAGAGLTDTSTAVRAIDAALNAYGLGADDAAKISDILFQTVNDGVLTFPQLANNMGSVLPIAAALGIGMEQLGAAYAVTTLKGIDASQAETGIAAILNSALNPTTALTDAVLAHGDASAADILKTKGLTGYLKFLYDATGGNADQMLKLTGNVEANKVAMALLTNQGADYTAEVEKMNHAQDGAGATAKAQAKQMESASYQFGQVQKEVGLLVTTFVRGLDPAMAGIGKGVAGLIGGQLVPLASTLSGKVSGEVSRVSKLFGYFHDERVTPLGKALEVFGTTAEKTGGRFGALGAATMAVGKVFQDLTGIDLSGSFRQIAVGLDQIAGGDIFAGIKSIAAGGLDLGEIAVRGTVSWAGDKIGDLKAWLGEKVGLGGDPAIPKGHGWGSLEGEPFSVGDIAVAGALIAAGDIATWAGNLWGWIEGKLGVGANVGDGTGGPESGQPIPLGDVAVNAALVAAGDIAAWAGNVWGWVQDQLGMGGGTGGGGPHDPHGGAEPFTVPDIAVAATLVAAGDIASWAGDLLGWVQDQLGIGGTGGPNGNGDLNPGGGIPLGDVAVNIAGWVVAEATGGTLVSDTKTYVEGLLKTVSAVMDGWKIDVKTPSGDSITIDVPAILSAIWGLLTAPLTVTPEQDAKISAFGQSIGKSFGDLVVAGVSSFFSSGEDGKDSGKVDISVAFNDFVSAAFGGVWEAVGPALSAELDKAKGNIDLAFINFKAGIGEKIATIFSGDLSAVGGTGSFQRTGGLFDGIVSFFTGLPGQIASAVGSLSIDIPMPTLPGWITNPLGFLNGGGGTGGPNGNGDLNPGGGGGVASMIGDFFTKIPGEVKTAVGGLLKIDIDAPSLPGWMTDGWADFAKATGAVVDAINTAAAGMQTAVAGYNTAKAALDAIKNSISGSGGTLPPVTSDPNPGQNDVNTGRTGREGTPLDITKQVNVTTVVTPVGESADSQIARIYGMGGGGPNGNDSLSENSSSALFKAIPLVAHLNATAKIDNESAVKSDVQTQLAGLFGGSGGTSTPITQTFTAKFEADNSGVGKQFEGAVSYGQAWAAASYSAQFDGDNSGAGKQYEGAVSYGQAWAAASYSAHFDGDNSGAGNQWQGAMDYGNAWASSSFTGFFDGDNSGAGNQWEGAMGYGNAWASSVFTAAFSIDLSGLYAASAAADAVAAHIAAVMPHSPAREGPLKEPIRFDYIADSLAATMGRMPEMARQGAGGVADKLSPLQDYFKTLFSMTDWGDKAFWKLGAIDKKLRPTIDKIGTAISQLRPDGGLNPGQAQPTVDLGAMLKGLDTATRASIIHAESRARVNDGRAEFGGAQGGSGTGALRDYFSTLFKMTDWGDAAIWKLPTVDDKLRPTIDKIGTAISEMRPDWGLKTGQAQPTVDLDAMLKGLDASSAKKVRDAESWARQRDGRNEIPVAPKVVNNTTHVYALKSDELAALMKQAETGAKFAEHLPRELGLRRDA
ncbi:MAG: phage tail tape measure protein [Thermomicrobiales bacterium]